ncbi:MAG: type II toxin-antitoxin system ParD family antitoxin [Endozoicomonadaceae bacterium]|nr:type II toxin-antitoxin system ParD family antitoxin [Endozoicomonadaceae bacterium]
MAMQRKTITITKQMENWVKSQVDSGKYGNDSEYFRDLVRCDQARKQAEMQLLGILDEAEASGLSKRTPQEIWDTIETQHQ